MTIFGCTVDYVSGRNRYMGYLITLVFTPSRVSRLAWTAPTVPAGTSLRACFDALGADTYVIKYKPNGLNINHNAGSTYIEGLQKFVVENDLDIGFA